MLSYLLHSFLVRDGKAPSNLWSSKETSRSESTSRIFLLFSKTHRTGKANGLTLLRPTALAGATRTCARSGEVDRAGAAEATGAAIILTVTRRGARMVTHSAKK